GGAGARDAAREPPARRDSGGGHALSEPAEVARDATVVGRAARRARGRAADVGRARDGRPDAAPRAVAGPGRERLPAGPAGAADAGRARGVRLAGARPGGAVAVGVAAVRPVVAAPGGAAVPVAALALLALIVRGARRAHRLLRDAGAVRAVVAGGAVG